MAQKPTKPLAAALRPSGCRISRMMSAAMQLAICIDRKIVRQRGRLITATEACRPPVSRQGCFHLRAESYATSPSQSSEERLQSEAWQSGHQQLQECRKQPLCLRSVRCPPFPLCQEQRLKLTEISLVHSASNLGLLQLAAIIHQDGAEEDLISVHRTCRLYATCPYLPASSCCRSSALGRATLIFAVSELSKLLKSSSKDRQQLVNRRTFGSSKMVEGQWD